MSGCLLLLHALILLFAILLCTMVGYHPHSGQDDYQGPWQDRDNDNNNAPTRRGALLLSMWHKAKRAKYGGDYKAQWHWMEIVYHLPTSQWCCHNLGYWGLDYPPPHGLPQPPVWLGGARSGDVVCIVCPWGGGVLTEKGRTTRAASGGAS